jgi:hypothetical protein
MQDIRISRAEIDVIAGTRAALGFGLGLLLAHRIPESYRRAIGWTLVTAGLVSTVPLLADVWSRRQLPADGKADAWQRVADHAQESSPAMSTSRGHQR